jgi:CRISPR RNA silencing complex Cmr2 subunit-like protein
VTDEKNAEAFAKQIQFAYREQSGGTSSITYAIQAIPIPDNIGEDKLMDHPLKKELLLLQYRLQQAKNNPPSEIALPSHPFMRPCDACGVEYAQHQGTKLGPQEENVVKDREKLDDEDEEKDDNEDEEEDDQHRFYCDSCCNKYQQDKNVKGAIKQAVRIARRKKPVRVRDGYLWDCVISLLQQEGYEFPLGKLPRRPKDFNAFRGFPGSKDYLALIYADGNGMGKALMEQDTLRKRKQFANNLDDSVFKAMAIAISRHLKIQNTSGEKNLFPFDILLVGGDDIVMVTPAAYAADVALTIAQEFESLTKAKDPKGKGYTLSVSVVLAPTKYPFGLLRDLAERALKFAKKHIPLGESGINFVTVTGNTSQGFDKVYQSLSKTRRKDDPDDTPEFYATLRPYNAKQFNLLLNAIRQGHKLGIGRTKLHQLREAILKKNLTTSVNDALAIVRNWQKDQYEYIVKHVYTLAGLHQEQACDPDNPSTWFPRVTFPWFASATDGKNVYRTTLLDFIELYDFVLSEERA